MFAITSCPSFPFNVGIPSFCLHPIHPVISSNNQIFLDISGYYGSAAGATCQEPVRGHGAARTQHVLESTIHASVPFSTGGPV